MVTTVNTPALAGLLLRPAEWLDTGNKSQPPAEDPQAAVVKISPEGARQAEAAAQVAPSTQQLQARLDGGGNGQVAPQESKAAAPEAPEAPPAAASSGGARSAAPAGGQAPAGGAGGGSAAVSTASASSTSQTYVPADTDEDGEVSPLEATAYEAKLAAEKQAQALANAPRAAEADAAVRTYAAVEQLGAAG